MKKFILIAITLFAFTGFTNAQSTTDGAPAENTESSGVDFYVATGLSVGNSAGSTFTMTSYPSVEFGMMKGNFALGLVGGRMDLDFGGSNSADNYWMSLKTAYYFPIGDSNIDGYGLLAIGNYLSTEQIFIEYGVGASYCFDSGLGLFGQASNWDGFWYITPGISYSF
jgi:hypothetical protein